MAKHTSHFVSRLVDFAENDEAPEFVIPEDLSSLSDSDLAALHEQAVSHFNTAYGDGTSLSDSDVATLSALTEGIESLATEVGVRSEAQAERTTAAEALAARALGEDALGTRVHTEERTETIDDTIDDSDPDPEAPVEDTDEAPVEEEDTDALPVAASAMSTRREIRVDLRGVRSRQVPPAPATATGAPTTMRDVVLAADVPGFVAGQGMDWDDLGRAVDRRLNNYNASAYTAAAKAGRQMREQFGVALIRKPFEPGLTINSSDQNHVDSVVRHAVDEHRLPGGSLVAAGGWCAPSETVYDLMELESRDGLVSVPEIGIARGGINFTPGPNFSTIYADAHGFFYTEAQDIASNYAVDSEGVGTGSAGSKPCYVVPCPSFTEKRLDSIGLCITAGLLQQRGYPEVIARTIRGALIAHDHRIAKTVLGLMTTGSTAVTMTAAQAGATAPLLDAIEKQVEHYRYTHRLGRGVTLEAVFPFWTHGAVRSDLARRNGVELMAVSDSEINGWFSLRGIAPQFVYNYQDLTGAAGSFKVWPATVTFLLYSAGTWVRGGADVITLDTIYDSVNLSENDFTALFTEEGMLMAKLGHDSRSVTVAICPDGTTGGSIQLACDGTNAGLSDNTNPVPGTVVASSILTTSFTLTVTGASDAGAGLDAEPYRVSTDAGSTWTEWQTSAVFAITGKTLDTDYFCRAEVRDKSGNRVQTPQATVHTAAS